MPSDPFQAQRGLMLWQQLEQRGIRDRRVLEAMGSVPREQFVPDELQDESYADRALPIECCQTISQPYIVALMTEALRLDGSEHVLEIGTGSGYQTAILSTLAHDVVSLERHAELSAAAGRRLRALGCRNVTLVVGDGTLGWAALAPYDRILVTASAPKPPAALVEQLAEGGLLVIPCGGPDAQTLQAVTKVGDKLAIENLAPCRFVPLLGAQGWPEE